MPADLTPALRNALGGVLAVALVCAGILGLQALVPAERDSPAVVQQPPDDVFALPPEPTSAAPTTRAPRPRPSRTPAAPAATPTATPTPSPTVAPRPSILVLNNSRVTGLAKKAAADFARGGWRIDGTGNLSGRVARTTVYYAPGQEAAAAALRRQYPAVADQAPRHAGLPGNSGLTVVVTRDYPH